jgi:dolichol-phosphate mannosyltransferase
MAISVREYLRRGWKFGLVGIGGFIVNQGGLMLLMKLSSAPLWLCGLVAIEVSIIANWFLNDSWTWRDRRNTLWIIRLLKYNLSAGFTAFGINYPILILLSTRMGVNYAIANIIGIGFASAVNFLINHHWTYGTDEAK